LVTLESKDYLFCTTGSGTLYSFYFYSEDGTLCEIHKVSINNNSNKFLIIDDYIKYFYFKMKPGNQSALLHKFQSHSTTYVFVCLANDPIIINTSGDKLIFSNIAIDKVNTLCSLNTEKYRNR